MKPEGESFLGTSGIDLAALRQQEEGSDPPGLTGEVPSTHVRTAGCQGRHRARDSRGAGFKPRSEPSGATVDKFP